MIAENVMTKSLILISSKPIIIHIFTLVCKKIGIKLEISNEVKVEENADIIIIDSEFIDNKFNNIKSYSSIMGAISKQELPFETANDFLIPSPFLPSSLELILLSQLEILNKRNNSKMYISNIDEIDMKLDVEDSDSFVEDIEKDNDDCIVSLSSLNEGGILDTKELSNLQDIIKLNDDINEDDFSDTCVDNGLIDLSSLIDDAIHEVNTFSHNESKFDNEPIKVLLNNFELIELTPLLNKFNQNIIDLLIDGHDVTLQIKLGNIKSE